MASKVKLIIECYEQTYEECTRIQGLSETAFVIANGTPYNPTGDLISREQIRKSLNEAFGCESATKYGNKNAEQQYKSYSTLMLYEIADIVEDCCDNAPTIEAPKIGCQSCQYLKFTEQFVENIVKVMIANDITTIEELKKRIGGSE